MAYNTTAAKTAAIELVRQISEHRGDLSPGVRDSLLALLDVVAENLDVDCNAAMASAPPYSPSSEK
jgi:hypothetical protein